MDFVIGSDNKFPYAYLKDESQARKHGSTEAMCPLKSGNLPATRQSKKAMGENWRVYAIMNNLSESNALLTMPGRMTGPRICSVVRASSRILSRSALTMMSVLCILMQMRTTLNIDDALLKQATNLTGVEEKTRLIHLGLQALISREAAKRLARLGGRDPHLKPIRRRRSA